MNEDAEWHLSFKLQTLLGVNMNVYLILLKLLLKEKNERALIEERKSPLLMKQRKVIPILLKFEKSKVK